MPPDSADRVAVGRLSATVMPDGAGLRDVSFGAEQVLRGIGFVVRDCRWGTYALTGSRDVLRDPNGVGVMAAGALDTPDGDLQWDSLLRMSADSLLATTAFQSARGFRTNRTGLVVLHALAASRGRAVRVSHRDRTVTQSEFPSLVAPHQPFMNLLGLKYMTAGGVDVSMSFLREVFETEDQRNWTDASFKTYSHALARGVPVQLAAGASLTQTITVSFSGAAPRLPADMAAPAVRCTAPLPRIEQADGPSLGPFADRNRRTTDDAVWEWSSTPTVHASDDDTIGETIEPLPDLIATAKARSPGCRIRIRPIRLTDGPVPDPRTGTMIEAAWVLGTIAGFLDPATELLGFSPPVGATRHLLARLGPLSGTGTDALDWPGQPRLRGLILRDATGPLLAIAHARAGRAEAKLPPGRWTTIERLGPDGFAAEPFRFPRLILNGFSVVLLRGAI